MSTPAETTDEDLGGRDDVSYALYDRFLPFDQACEEMRPFIGARFDYLAQHAVHTLFCPFSLTGLAKLEKMMGRYRYQPVAIACGFPLYPNCPKRSGERAAPCHCHHVPSWSSLRAHVRGENDNLHKMFLEEIVMIRSCRGD